MDSMPFVSVVVPARDEGRCLGKCIRALLSLDYPPDGYEVIVVNNGSRDGTGAVIDGYPVRRVDEPTRGGSRARNAGVRAARGEIIAFTDADCIPETGWLRELLVGSDACEVGCFAGEFAPQPFRGMVDEYVHDRRLINQGRLLSFIPPVVAAGNVAYRKGVFDQIGLFDESFTSGEDGEFSWRMQTRTRFRVRYNYRAVVSHSHPSSVWRLLRRAYLGGIGLALFRLKYTEDFPKRMTSRIHYGGVMMLTALGLARYPAVVAQGIRAGLSPDKCLAYPVLDKLCALAQEAGILRELAQGTAEQGATT